MSEQLIQPHGGELCELLVGEQEAAELKASSVDWPSWDLTTRQACDLELLLSGAFSPLRGFMGKADREAVCHEMRLADGTLWSIPVTLDVTGEVAAGLECGGHLALRDAEGVMLAVLDIEEIWTPDREAEAEQVYGTSSDEHPGVRQLLREADAVCLGGTVRGVEMPVHHDFTELRLTPRGARAQFARLGWRRVAGFHSGEPLHRAGHEFIMRAVRESEANVFLHPVVGGVTAGGIDDYTLVRCFKAAQQHFPPHVAQLAVLPLAPRMAGRREAVWQAIVRKNFGCSLLITKSAPPEAEGNSRQPPSGFEEELGVTILEDGPDAAALSSAEVRNLLEGGDVLPGGFAFPEVEAELRRSCPPRGRQGFTVFFTGLSGSGKSTVANALRARLLEIGGRQVTLLDGDLVRKNLSSELSFSKEHREINIQRIGFVASEITRNGGVAICAPIAPYRSTRRKVRELIEARGGFILVHVATPVEVCEARDRKGLYAKARAGLIKEFTGISDPYEEPAAAEIVIDTREFTPDEASQHILSHLEREGYLGGDPG